MKKLILLLSLFNFLCSCVKEDEIIEKSIVVKSYNYFTGQKIENSMASFIWNDVQFGSVISNFVRDTFELLENDKLFESELFDKTYCISRLIFHNSNYHPLWAYNLCRPDFEDIDTFQNPVKPIVNLQLEIRTEKELVSLRSIIEDKYVQSEPYRQSNFLIADTRIDKPDSPFGDTIINLPIIQDDTILLKIYFKEKGAYVKEKEIEIITNTDVNFIQEVEF